MPINTANAVLALPLTGGKSVETGSTQARVRGTVANLTQRLAAGEDEAFREFHARYFDPLYHFLLVVCRGREIEAQEALQQTFLRVVRYARVFESEEAFWSWLKVVARSAARDAGRKERRYLGLIERLARRVEVENLHASNAEENVLREALEECLTELEPGERRLLESKYVAGLTMEELSMAEGGTERAIESRLLRLRRRLRDQILNKLGKQ
jgi:RNA polymerase sigma-70 factor (ECF subfamily)